MPYKSEKIKIQGTQYDRRKTITDEMKKDIFSERGVLSQRVTARKYGVSRRMVTFIWYPERLERHKELAKERRMDGRYYDKEAHTKAMRDHRKWKQVLYTEGLI